MTVRRRRSARLTLHLFCHASDPGLLRCPGVGGFRMRRGVGEGDLGRVEVACHSFRLKKNIGYAWVAIELAEPGTQEG